MGIFLPHKINKPYGYFTGIIILILQMIFPLDGMAFPGKQNRETIWYLTGSSGIAFLNGEITREFAVLKNEFRHQPGFAFDLSIGRTLGQRFEPTFRLGVYTLFGESDLPQFSATGYHAALPVSMHQAPVEYITQSSAVSLIMKIYLRNNPGSQTIRFNPFIEAGVGINSFKSELRYQRIPPGQNSPVIFRKSNGEYPFGVAQIITGLGTKIGTPGKWNAVLLWNADVVNYATLDAVHNFTNGERDHARGIVSRITAGITIPLRRNIDKDNYLPFRRW
jgi:hypothetical protein